MKNVNKLCELFDIQYPIIQAGMIWASGWRLAAAVSNAGGLGLIGSGSMHPEVLKEHIQKCKQNTNKPFGVNVPLLYPQIDEIIQIIIDEKVPIVFTSAGNPAKYTALLKSHGCKVVHVIASTKFAIKAENAGCDAVVAEGFEAGGHNGKEETTTLVLVPLVADAVSIPVIAAGGIASGRQMLASFALGAEGVQIGSRFLCTEEASSHLSFKEMVVAAKEGDTLLSMKKTVPVRLLKNDFFDQVNAAEVNGATPEVLNALLGHGRAKKGMFEGDLVDGELEIGQVSAMIHSILPAKDVVSQIMNEFHDEKEKLLGLSF